MNLRAYQLEAIDRVRRMMAQGKRRVVLTVPTGGGKTVLGGEIVRRAVANRKRALFVAHRSELIEQSAATLERFGLTVGAICASSAVPPNPFAPVQVASVQTLIARSQKPAADLIIADECHHYAAAAESYSAILASYPDAYVVGLTATPERGDGCGLGTMFDGLAVGATVAQLTRDHHLVPCEILRPDKPLAPGEIAQNPVDAYVEHASGRQAIVFARSVALAEEYAQEFKLRGIEAHAISADTPWAERRMWIDAFRRGAVRVLVNCYVLTEGFDAPETSCCVLARGCGSAGMYLQMCLDAQTEILTRRGWVGPDTITGEDEVCAVDLSSDRPIVVWERPLSVTDRPMGDGEHMIGIQSPRLDIRVTDQHTVFHRHNILGGRGRSAWLRSTAADRAAAHGAYEIPSAAFEDAPGVPLTDAELRVIGWYMTDGSISRTRKQLHIYQAESSPFVGEIHRCLQESGIKYGVSRAIPRDAFPNAQPRLTFTASYGMPRCGHGMSLRGWAHLERYMEKRLAPALEPMSDRQLSVLLEAMHWGDGAKQIGQTWTRRSYHIATKRRELSDRLQSICLRRGWSCNVSTEQRETGPFYYVRIKNTFTRHIGGAGHSDRPTLGRVPFTAGERVWCVETRSGAIVVRRNGKACVLGNCGRILRPCGKCETCVARNRGEDAGPCLVKQKAMLLDLRGASHEHGRPDSPREFSLDGKGIRLKDGNSYCPVCGAPRTPPDACEACGYSPSSEDGMKPDRVTGDRLVPYAYKRQENDEQRFATLVRWMRIAAQKGYRSGWIRAKWRAVYDCDLPGSEIARARASISEDGWSAQ